MIIIYIAVIVISIILHEISHGYAAYALGDRTAYDHGRLTLNPIPHLDLLGSIILPVVLVISQAGILFGWAKPVPINMHNLRGGKWGEIFVSAAGILSHMVVIIICALLVRLLPLPFSAIELISVIVFINLILALFNALPIPPLDGSHILHALLPPRLAYAYHMYCVEPITRHPFITLFVAIVLINIGALNFLFKGVMFLTAVIVL